MAVSSLRRAAPTAPERARVRAARPTLGLALAAPVVLFGGVVLAESVQRPGAYDPIGQTVSTLAGLGATDRWLMTSALLLLGMIYLAVARGLHGVPALGRGVLALGGACVVLVALAPQPARGSSVVHMAAMVTGCLAFALWPVVAVAAGRLDRRVRTGSVAATLVMLGLLGWLCAQAWTDGTWLGAAERTLLAAETVWPIRMAVAGVRGAAPVGDPRAVAARLLDRAALPLALLAPVVLVGGIVAAVAAQPGADPVVASVSTLAGRGATDRWIMTGSLLALGAIYLLVAAGLRRIPTAARLLLGLGGALVLVAALAAQPAGGSNPVHMVSAGFAWLAFVGWPLALVGSPALAPGLRRGSVAASGVLALLVAWFAVELWTGGELYGASQRVVLVAQTAWPIVVAVAARAAAPRAEHA